MSSSRSRPASWIAAWPRSRSNVVGVRSGIGSHGAVSPSVARVGIPALDEALRGGPGHARDERQVIVGLAPCDAGQPPATDPAVVDRIGIGRGGHRRSEDPVLEAGLDEAMERGEVGVPVVVRLAVAGDDREDLRRPPCTCPSRSA